MITPVNAVKRYDGYWTTIRSHPERDSKRSEARLEYRELMQRAAQQREVFRAREQSRQSGGQEEPGGQQRSLPKNGGQHFRDMVPKSGLSGSIAELVGSMSATGTVGLTEAILQMQEKTSLLRNIAFSGPKSGILYPYSNPEGSFAYGSLFLHNRQSIAGMYGSQTRYGGATGSTIDLIA